MSEKQVKPKKPFFKRWWFILIVAIVAIGVIGSMGNDDTKVSNAGENTSNSSDTAKDKKEEKKDVYVNTAEAAQLYTGEYIVGDDVKAGRYDITCASGSGNFFVYDGGMPVVNEILASSSEEVLGLGITKIQYDLEDGQKIIVSGINQVDLTPATVSLNTTLCTGMHIVGRDVPAGSYVATAPEGSGNFFVYTKTGMPRVNEILGKDDYGLAVEKVKLTLKDGEIVVISGIETVELGQ